MLKMFLKSGEIRPNGLEGFDMEKALKKIPAKELAMMTFKQLNDHVATCSQNSERTLKGMKWVGYMVMALALEKLNEMFHFVTHLPIIPGG